MKKIIYFLFLLTSASFGIYFPDQPSFPDGSGSDIDTQGIRTTSIDPEQLSSGDSSVDTDLDTIFGQDSDASQQYDANESKYSYLDPKESKSEENQIDYDAMLQTYKYYSGDCAYAEDQGGRTSNYAACAPGDW